MKIERKTWIIAVALCASFNALQSAQALEQQGLIQAPIILNTLENKVPFIPQAPSLSSSAAHSSQPAALINPQFITLSGALIRAFWPLILQTLIHKGITHAEKEGLLKKIVTPFISTNTLNWLANLFIDAKKIKQEKLTNIQDFIALMNDPENSIPAHMAAGMYYLNLCTQYTHPICSLADSLPFPLKHLVKYSTLGFNTFCLGMLLKKSISWNALKEKCSLYTSSFFKKQSDQGEKKNNPLAQVVNENLKRK